jgi:tripartite-type tricarboxylate transporter receptor subunit TctC
VAARKDFPAKDLKEFIASVKEYGDGVKQAHGGTGCVAHGLPAVHLAARS